VRCLMEEMFGRENFVNLITFKSQVLENQDYLSKVADYVIWYAKSYKDLKYNELFYKKPLNSEYFDKTDDMGKLYRLVDLFSQGIGNTEIFEFKEQSFVPPKGHYWQIPPQTLPTHRLEIEGNFIKARVYFEDFPLSPIDNIWNDKEFMDCADCEQSIFDKVIQRCLLMSTDPNDLIFIPNFQSGHLVFAAEHWGRRWIACDAAPQNFALVSIRLMAARYPYYLLADSKKGIEKQAIINDEPVPADSQYNDSLEKGFVYNSIAHITLESIANNSALEEVEKKWAKKFKSLKKQLDKSTARKWKAWDIPVEAPLHWQPKAKEFLENWWQYQREYQQDIDNTIEKQAVKQKRYDQPYVDDKLIRVSSPFTMEKIQPKQQDTHFILPFKVNISTNASGKLKARKDGKYQISILSVELPDSTVKNVENGLNEILCWFVDDNYDGQHFVARHLYFTGNTAIYEKLRTVMDITIAESAWSKIGTTKSYPFPAPKTGKVAVKVLNQHYETVLSVLEI